MAVSGISQAVAAGGAYVGQASSGDAQHNPFATLQGGGAAAQTQLSGPGRVKYSLADLQAKAQALLNFNNPPTLGDFKTLVQGFVQAFNSLNKTVSEVSSQKQGALYGDAHPVQSLNEIRKAAAGTNDSSLGALQKLGIDRQKDGTFSINQKTLDQSFQADGTGALDTISEVADRVGKVIDKQLSGNGSIGKKEQDLSARPSNQENNRNSSQERLDTQKNYQQRLAAQLANAGGFVARNAVATYFNVASL